MEESPTSTQIETAEHEIILVEQPRIRPMMSPTSSDPWRTGGSRTRSWTGSYSATREAYRSLRGRRAVIRSALVDRPHHREFVSAAIAAGKAVYCEWPLGRDLDDARAMAALAAKQGVRTVVGLQARQAPAIEFVQELLRDGYVGEVLSTTMIGLSIPGDVVGQPNAYMLDKTNGANLLTVPVGHSLDILNYVLGEFADLSAVSDVRRPRITIKETGEQIVKTAPDQIAVIGTLTSEATASVHVREAVAGGIGFLWEINGTDGTLRITADAAYPEIFPLTVAGAHGRSEPAELTVPTALTQKWPTLTNLEGAPAFNVARAYAAFAAGIDNGNDTVPDFADAVGRHEVIAAIERSAASGKRVKA